MEFNIVSVIFRLLLAMGIGAMFGTDRSKKGSPAGLKTHSLVCVGSALVMLTSEYIMYRFNTGDIGRMPAQVISGIGFLGAGTILVTGNNQIKGLTSAASIWFSACVGLTIGIGFYSGAIIAAVFEIIVVKLLSKTKFQRGSKTYEIYLEYDDNFNLSSTIKTIKSFDCHILSMENQCFQTYENDFPGTYHILFTIQMKREREVKELLEGLRKTSGILMASDL